MAAYRYDKVLIWELTVLVEEEEICQSTKKFLKN